MKPRALVLWLLLSLIASVGCTRGSSTKTSSPSPTPSGAPSPQTPSPSAPTASVLECGKSEGGVDTHVYLSEIRVGTHDGFDRVTFQFTSAPSVPANIPKYQIEDVAPPLKKGPSDEPMQVEGSAFVRALFFGAERYNRSTDPAKRVYTGPDEFRPGFPVLKEAELQEDFEATMSWILGLNKRSCPRVQELTGPLRVVVDLPH